MPYYPNYSPKKKETNKTLKILGIFLLLIATSGSAVLLSPFILTTTVKEIPLQNNLPEQFPITVNPITKTITENTEVNNYLETKHSLFQAAAGDTINLLWKIFETIADNISSMPWYQNLAGVGSERFVTISAGFRKEQVADAFAKKLGWNSMQKNEFLTPLASSTLPLSEGSFFPGLYAVDSSTTPLEAQIMVNERFSDQVLSHYGTSTAQIVPVSQALTIASLIERETISTDGMRLISGVMWNRLFKGMPLQIDSTLQYAAANSKSTKTWWPTVKSSDKYIKSPYNTYLNPGLPPTPIANPSVEAILAALNPTKTDCLYYFNDPSGKFHCSVTYEEHKKLLKEYYQ